MNKIKKIYIFPAVFGVLLILLAVFGVYPIFKDIKTDSEEFVSVKNRLATLETEIQGLERAKKQNQDYQANLEKSNSLFIDPEIPIDFVRFLETVASDSGVNIGISFLSNLQSQPWPSLSFSLDITGPYNNFSRFLDKIENAPYLISIQDLAIDKSSSGKVTNDIRASISILVFTK